MSARHCTILVSLAAFCALAPAGRAERTLVEWRFDGSGDFNGWRECNHIRDLRVENGALRGRIMNWDPFVIGPKIEIQATPWQRVDLRLKTNGGGDGEIFWTNTTHTRYGGFSPGKETHFQVVGDNRWHVYHITPYWQHEKRIIRLRLDLPRPGVSDYGKKTFALAWIRIVDLGPPVAAERRTAWNFPRDAAHFAPLPGTSLHPENQALEIDAGSTTTPGIESHPLQFKAETAYWLSFEMAVDRGKRGLVRWVAAERNGLHSRSFPIVTDGRFHVYNLDMSASAAWRGNILLLQLIPSTFSGMHCRLRRLAVAAGPQGPPEVVPGFLGFRNALPRAGNPLTLVLYLDNRGGAPAENLRIAGLSLPPGLHVRAKTSGWKQIPAIDPFDPVIHAIPVLAEKPVNGECRIRLEGPGAPDRPIRARLRVLPHLALPRAAYVPKPRPVPAAGGYKIGAYYFPGWNSVSRWMPIYQRAPERKPVLGWYDEANPECVDWQIKWAVENGISFFMVDWYWSAGQRHLEHWVHAFAKARYRRYLQWCVMWANHNRPGTHSVSDQIAVTRYWIQHCFNMPEYLHFHGRPVVIVWSPQNMERDMRGKGGAAALLAASQKTMHQAGLPPIWFVAMKWPEAKVDAGRLRQLRQEGFDMTAIYHYMDSGGLAKDPKNFPFRLVVQSSPPFWKKWLDADTLPFLLPISTGWDARPWHGNRTTVIYGRTVPLFHKLCEEAKQFADAHGLRWIALGPLNEWGEGSYIEPCKQFGFGMYEAVRDVFCKKPAGGWPLNYGPADVGLGPYDLPVEHIHARTEWDFRQGAMGWGPLMGVRDFAVRDGKLRFVTTNRDPAVGWPVGNLAVRPFRYALLRLKISPPPPGHSDVAQLFWHLTTASIREGTSVRFPLAADGRFHDYLIPLDPGKGWHGRIVGFRFDPCSRPNATVEITGFKLLHAAPKK